jgi:DNA-binding PadR family transcriptional regulator
MSPSDLELLIHCHACPAPHPRLHAPAIQAGLKRFLAAGVIEYETSERKGSGYMTTEKGQKWLKMILDTPYPEHRWVDPRDSEYTL